MTNKHASNMKLNLQHLNVRSRDDLDRWVEEQILALGEARQIDEAIVRLAFSITPRSSRRCASAATLRRWAT